MMNKSCPIRDCPRITDSMTKARVCGLGRDPDLCSHAKFKQRCQYGEEGSYDDKNRD